MATAPSTSSNAAAPPGAAPTVPPAAAQAGMSGQGPSTAAAPEDDVGVDLELLLPSGSRHRWRFSRDTSVGDVKQVVFKEWPQDWLSQGPSPTSVSDLRLLYLGKFLMDKEKLSEQRGKESPTMIMHLMLRPPPVPEDEDTDLKKRRRKSVWCCIVS